MWKHPVDQLVAYSCYSNVLLNKAPIKLTTCREESTEHPDEQGESHTASIHVHPFGCDEDPAAHHAAHDEGNSRPQTNTASQVNLIFLPTALHFLARHLWFISPHNWHVQQLRVSRNSCCGVEQQSNSFPHSGGKHVGSFRVREREKCCWGWGLALNIIEDIRK